MNQNTRHRGLPKDQRGREPHGFRALLVPTDLSPGSDRVLGRVALLPLAEDARITLLHVVPSSLPVGSQLRAERDAKKVLAGEARHLAKSLPRAVSIQSVVKVGVAFEEIAAHAHAMKAELIVMGRGSGRPLADVFLGSTAERVIRRGRLPVLVVRLPARVPYGQPALALDLDRCAQEVLGMLLRTIRPPRPRVAVIHAFDVPYRRMVYPSLSERDAEEQEEHLKLVASRKLTKLLSTSLAQAKVPPAEAPHWKMQLLLGSPRLVIQKAVRKAETDLLLLGTHGYSGLAHMFLGTVAGDVLREVACDVLVVPPRSRGK